MKPIIHLLATASTLALLHAQGPLTPPAAPAPTMKTLAQIEARTAIPPSVITAPIAGPHYTITQPGSYYLTGNIEVTSGDGIQINASNVTLDLNGFALISTAVPNPISGSAVLLGPGVSNIQIKNGNITGGTIRTYTGPSPWQATYARAGWISGILDDFTTPSTGVILSQLTVEKCGSGIYLSGKSAVLSHCTSTSNAGYGIYAQQGDVTNSSASNNGLVGMDVDRGTVTSSTASGNGSSGISSTEGTITSSTAIDNIIGIYALQGTVTNSTANRNGGTGIYALNGTVTSCRAVSNGTDGINVSLGVAAHCVASGNDTGGGPPDFQIKVTAGGQRIGCVPATEAGSP